jgi:hypothetical protein
MLHEYIEFVREREEIRLRKGDGFPRPWTEDPILATGYFCNVRRNDDRVTRWLREHWFEPNQRSEDLWFLSAVARNVNLPATLSQVSLPLPWDAERFISEMSAAAERSSPIYNNAYMIRAGATNGASKASYLANRMFTPLWEQREALRPRWGDSLAEFHHRLSAQHGFGSFLAQQVVADVMYYEPLVDAPDWYSFCAEGPGSVQGMNAILGRPLRQKFVGDEFKLEVGKLQEIVNTRLGFRPALHRQDVTNTLCEFVKYYKAKRGITHPKRRYTPR